MVNFHNFEKPLASAAGRLTGHTAWRKMAENWGELRPRPLLLERECNTCAPALEEVLIWRFPTE